jgi:ubiquinone/menaquinone biosynthesis C-methylase UbiE
MADVKAGDVLYDLGSGDGRIITMATKEFHATSVGIDINPFWILWTRAKIVLFRLSDKVKVIWGNFFNHDLSKANIVILYLFQDTNNRLKPKLERELKPGTRVISYIFTFDGWNPEKVDHESKIYMYKIGDTN